MSHARVRSSKLVGSNTFYILNHSSYTLQVVHGSSKTDPLHHSIFVSFVADVIQRVASKAASILSLTPPFRRIVTL